MAAKPDAHFDPNAFEVRSFEHALHVTIGNLEFADGSRITCEDRWEPETAYTVSLIQDLLDIHQRSRLLDYGCGTGRISKGLIEACGCSIDGIDASHSMRAIASHYVVDHRFRVLAPWDLSPHRGWRYDYVFTVFVLQHTESPRDDVRRIHAALRPGGSLLVINENGRYVPTREYGFASDGVDVRACLSNVFGQPIRDGRLDPSKVTKQFSERSWWALYQRSPSL